MNQWNELKTEFDADGSLRDIYVFKSDVTQWEIFLDSIVFSEYNIEFTHGKNVVKVPTEMNSIRILQESNPTILTVWVNRIRVNCHFFIDSEIEMDISPTDINTESDFNALMGFLSWLSQITKSDVVLTHENAASFEIAKVEY